MNRHVNILVSLLLSTVLAGCAAGAQPEGSGDRPAPSSTQRQTPPERSSKQAVSVTFKQSGGIAAMDETVVFAAGRPVPGGRTKADVREVLELASNPELINADLEPMPKDTCCDRRTYVMSILWDDGSRRVYTSLDGLEQPRVFEELLTKVA